MTYNQKTLFLISLFVFSLAGISGVSLLNLQKTPQSNVSHSNSLTARMGEMVVQVSPKKTIVKISTFQSPKSSISARLERPVFKSYSRSSTPLTSNNQTEIISSVLPLLVIYEDELVIEFPKKLASSHNIKRAIVRVLLSNNPQAEKDLLTKQSFNLKQTPYFYKKIADENNYPIRYPKQAYRYANFILENMSENFSDEEGDFVLVHIPLLQSNLKGAARDYQEWVENYSQDFDVKPSLIYAIMETESAFNPQAVSRSNAIGLMQIKANAAGKDVHNLIDNKKGKPSVRSLFDAENNIRVGTAYLGLLNDEYLSGVKNEKIKEMMAISSYNGGLSRVLALFGKTPKKAIRKVNRMHPKAVYNKLRFEHKSLETRNYLDKVLQANAKYKKQLNIPSERY